MLDEKVIVPEWSEKIIFNGLSGLEEQYLNNGFFQVTYLDDYLQNNSEFLADENGVLLKNKKNLTTKEQNELDFYLSLDQAIANTYVELELVRLGKKFNFSDEFEVWKELYANNKNRTLLLATLQTGIMYSDTTFNSVEWNECTPELNPIYDYSPITGILEKRR